MKTMTSTPISNSTKDTNPTTNATNNEKENQKTPKTYFSFDKSFQEKIIQAMLIDRQWAAQFTEVVDVEFFQYAPLKKICDSYLTYYKKYKEFPSIELLATILGDDLTNPADYAIRSQIKDLLIDFQENRNLGDLSYVKEKSLDFCKRAALQNALMDSIEFIKTENYEKIIETIKTAIARGNEHTSGLDLFEDVEARYSETYRKTVPTGVPELDTREILNGGLGAGELGIVIAPTGVGKSHFLVHVGAQAILAGKNVLHYTMELNERATGIRYDSHLLDTDSLDCYGIKGAINEYYKANVEDLGRLRIKYYPTSSVTVNTLRAHMDKLATVEGFIPDLIIIDYCGIMRSTDKHELLRLELKKICEELRGFANEVDVPVWSAIQSNKEGAEKDYVDLTNMAEAYGQAHVADFVVGLSRKSLSKSTGYGNMFIAKNRAGRDGLQYSIYLNTARSKLRVVSANEAEVMTNQSKEAQGNVMRNVLRQKIRDMRESE